MAARYWIHGALTAAVAILAGTAVLARQAQTPPPALRPAVSPPASSPAPTSPPPAQTAPTPAPIAATPVPAPASASAPTPVQAAPPPTEAAAVPVVPAKPAEPPKRGRSGVAILQALDKVTTETLRFEAPVGQPIRYKTLIFTVRACETSASDEAAPESAAYVVVDTQPKAVAGRVAPPGRQIYKGWMYANSPGLNPLQHPVYDAWLIACKTSVPVAPAANR